MKRGVLATIAHLLGRPQTCAVCSKKGHHRDDVCARCRGYGWSAPQLFTTTGRKNR